MFSKTSRHGEKATPSIVSPDAAIFGDIRSDGDVQVEGKVTGDISCKRLTLGRESEVDGKIECETVHLHGKISGEIHAETVLVSETAHVSGDVHHESISVETGARVEGRLVRREPKATPLNLVTDQSATAPAS